ncbi:DUF6059 family protein [Streptomyces ficellus]|uniref:DUF6059 family protein n=1 Tax=Streptomyces ficellus TaxID=1977088 RepID=UPI0025B18039|nr:DUF6059 family protein [Streptomyces ficellus]
MTRVLRGCYDALVAAGWMWLGVPLPPPLEARPALSPPRGHPERLRPDLPPTPAELALWQRLTAPARGRR